MPYITPAKRVELEIRLPANAGELNYVLTSRIRMYWLSHDRNYQTINDIIGALEGAKAEFQRQVVAPYEDSKIHANGGIY